jgi:microcin C transport system substrate-binding protein
MKTPFVWFVLLLALLGVTAAQGEVYQGHAIALHGDIKYGPDFTHFEYVDPDAPKGGEILMASIGSYDSFNSFISEGITPAGLGIIYDSLTTSSRDEPFTEYGLLAETIEVPADNSWVQYTLRSEARWHDGTPITADDVVFSFEIQTTQGAPGIRSYYAAESVEKIDDSTVRFVFSGETNNELPLIMGQLTIIPKHYWEGRDFSATTLEAPLGSGPYRIGSFDAGRSISYERVEDYWGSDLPVNAGRYNFDTISYEYFRDPTVTLEAFKAGEYDFRTENIAQDWATAYEIPARDQGHLIQELVTDESGEGMQAFWFNTRLDKFSDPRVREALGYAFDFEWSNANLFYGQYTRTESFFSNSELASGGLPQGIELEILEEFRGRIPDEVFTEPFTLPRTDGSGNIRDSLRAATDLLAEAGWEIRGGKLTNVDSGEVMVIEFLLRSPSFERVVAPFVQNLERLGVEASIRLIDNSQWVNRVLASEFDIFILTRRQSLSPGNEQRNYWSSEAADISGAGNFAGIKNPVIDELIDRVISAPDRETLVAATHALDRVLLSGHYVVPQWHLAGDRIVYWNKFGRPEINPRFGLDVVTTWWVDEDRLATLIQGQ